MAQRQRDGLIIRRSQVRVLLPLLLLVTPVLAEPPARASAYRPELVRAAHATWGLTAPVATFAGQIHQESGWNPAVCSAYACGLTQFTGSTAEWIQQVYGTELGSGGVFNPRWAIRALVRYDKHLWDRLDAASDCDRMAMVLASYNGGLTWVYRDQAIARKAGSDPAIWWGNVERFSARADWAFKENRDYPRKILKRWQPQYATWGPVIVCTDGG